MHKISLCVVSALLLTLGLSSPAYATGEGLGVGLNLFLIFAAVILYLITKFVSASFKRPKTAAEKSSKWDTIFVALIALLLLWTVIYQEHLWTKILLGVFAAYLVIRFFRWLNRDKLPDIKPDAERQEPTDDSGAATPTEERPKRGWIVIVVFLLFYALYLYWTGSK